MDTDIYSLSDTLNAVQPYPRADRSKNASCLAAGPRKRLPAPVLETGIPRDPRRCCGTPSFEAPWLLRQLFLPSCFLGRGLRPPRSDMSDRWFHTLATNRHGHRHKHRDKQRQKRRHKHRHQRIHRHRVEVFVCCVSLRRRRWAAKQLRQRLVAKTGSAAGSAGIRGLCAVGRSGGLSGALRDLCLQRTHTHRHTHTQTHTHTHTHTPRDIHTLTIASLTHTCHRHGQQENSLMNM